MLGWTALHHMSTHSTQHSILPALVPTHVPTSAGGQFERVVEEVLGPLAATEQDLNQVWSGLEARASDIFSAADQSDDDLLSKAELKRHLKRDADCAALVRTGGFKTLWEDLDSDSDGRISRAEFVQHYCRAFKEAGFQAVQEWAQGAMHDSALSHSQLETLLAGFECKFLGGQGRELELITTGGGTRSINLALECVLAGSTGPAKILTGNPHLAVERAERRFGFQLVRLVEGGRLSVSALRQHIADPQVVAVYSQSLSYTDGISDQLQEIFQVVEEQNLVRASNSTPLVTLINDSCLALSALVHNDGVDGRASLRVLDLSRGALPVLRCAVLCRVLYCVPALLPSCGAICCCALCCCLLLCRAVCCCAVCCCAVCCAAFTAHRRHHPSACHLRRTQTPRHRQGPLHSHRHAQHPLQTHREAPGWSSAGEGSAGGGVGRHVADWCRRIPHTVPPAGWRGGKGCPGHHSGRHDSGARRGQDAREHCAGG
eukprot:TRINITY_DN1760_c0_g1_i2.p1 TRINITY_DN1760_c0_g1~~TRINITY_DN1760_c0_g1_i2.p1  ORF type:complete len:488 (+),score=114.55 TRINITY_DN1760_c0_g1_i2:329-1792(+)